jgi:SAM-dependent methyltransferase
MRSQGIFSPEDAKTQHKTSRRLAKALLQVLPANRPVHDFGCGRGEYIQYLNRNGMKVFGYEGTKGMAETVGFEWIREVDITQPMKFDKEGSVLCLEVLEHIEPDLTDAAIANLVDACSGRLIVSWAVKGQGGHGHVNEQDAEYVLGRFAKEGFLANFPVSEQLRREAGADLWWFKKSIYVFDKKK